MKESYSTRLPMPNEDMELLHAVYADLERARPRGLRYDTFRLDGGGSFLTLIESDGDPVSGPAPPTGLVPALPGRPE